MEARRTTTSGTVGTRSVVAQERMYTVKVGLKKLLSDIDERPRWITIPEAARRAGVPKRTMYNWLGSGKCGVTVHPYGDREYRLLEDEFDRWLKDFLK